MSSKNRLIEREDLERLERLSRGAGNLLETHYNNQLAEEALARIDVYKDRFETLSQLVAERQSQHQAQQQLLRDIEARLQQTKSELSETQVKLKGAIADSDIEATGHLNNRQAAIQLVLDNLERKLEEARQQLATTWQSFDGARAQVLDLRRLVDNDATGLERVTAIVVHNTDPALEEIRARHNEQLNRRYEPEARSPRAAVDKKSYI